MFEYWLNAMVGAVVSTHRRARGGAAERRWLVLAVGQWVRPCA